MSRNILCQTAGITQLATEACKQGSTEDFEAVGVTIEQMMTNLVDHGDMLYGEDRPQRRKK